MVVRVPVLLFCFSSVSSRPLGGGGGEVVRGRGRALPPNLLASHNYHKASHNYQKGVLPQNILAAPPNLLASHNSYLSDKELIPQNQPPYYYGVKKDPSQNFYDSQADDKEHFPANLLYKQKPHKKKSEKFPSHSSKFGDAENSFSLELPDFFKQHAEAQPSAISSRFQWSPMRLLAPRRSLIDRAGWETEKRSWSEERRRADAEGPPFGDILERSGREEQKEVEEERSVSLGGWKPLSEGWTKTPDIWTNEVESPVITIDNYKRYLDNGIGGGGLHQKKKNFEKVVKGSIRVTGDHNSPAHLIINRP